MRKIVSLLAGAAALLFAGATAAETLTVPFTTPSVATVDSYSGIVNVRVSGIGFSNSTLLNDAFYNVPSGAAEGSGYYQLGFGTAPLVPYDYYAAIVNNVAGGRPAYQASHIYNFQLNTGLMAPGKLYFGVTDGIFTDNGGEYEITVTGSGVPEPATWGLMILGFGAVGYGMRRAMRRSEERFTARIRAIAEDVA